MVIKLHLSWLAAGTTASELYQHAVDATALHRALTIAELLLRRASKAPCMKAMFAWQRPGG